MLKINAKRRRTRAEIEAEKAETVKRQQDVEKYLREKSEHERELKQIRDQAQFNGDMKQFFEKLIRDGFIKTDEHGNAVYPEGEGIQLNNNA